MTLSDQLRVANEDAFKLQQELRELGAKLADSQRQLVSLENVHKTYVATLTTEWEKKIAGEKSLKDHYSSQASKANDELEQIHIILDAVEGAPARELENSSGYNSTKRAVGTRVAGAFLAIASRSSVKTS
tara:strand:+ start:220 stop:609 length:390 start_codon:yes stop_codon:yes gene_type:complete